MSAVPPNRRILVIDDNESIHRDFRKILTPAIEGKSALADAAAELFGGGDTPCGEASFEVDSAFQGREGLEKVRAACAEGRPYAMAFIDIRMPPGWDGIETIQQIWAEYPELEVVICTAYSDYSLEQIVEKLGRSDRLLILKKPFDAIEVLQFADALTEKWRLALDARAKVEDLEARVAERTRELVEGQQQLVEARKMELVGKLAGGVAHDFNTLLTSILGHAELIAGEAAQESQIAQSAQKISRCANAAATLTRQLLAFSRRQMLQPQLVDVNVVIGRMEPALNLFLGSSIKLSIVENARHSWIRVDLSQIEEVLMSLAENARDAMPNGGHFILETADVTVGPEDRSLIPELSPGEYVMVSIVDSGCGMAEETKTHVFEPYYSTKPPGVRKGLGLAVCHGILKQSGGHITFASEAGRGATFNLYFPRYQPDAGEAAPAAPAPASGRTGVILLVQECPALRGVAASVLESAGYTVHRAAGSREAISIAGRIAGVDLLIADVAMAEMTGKELATWISSLHPALKTLYTSPFGGENSGAGTDTLHEPYSPQALLSAVGAALGASVSSAA